MSSQTRDDGFSEEFPNWEPIVDAVIDFSRRYDEAYRPAIVHALLLSRTGVSGQAGTGSTEVPPLGDSGSGQVSGLAAAAKEAGVDRHSLRRIVELDDDGTLQILARISGDSIAERSNRYAAIYCYLKEKALGELDSHMDEIRALCKKHGCYDSKNFARNLRTGGLLLEIGDKGSADKRYRLSSQGEEAAREILRNFLGDES